MSEIRRTFENDSFKLTLTDYSTAQCGGCYEIVCQANGNTDITCVSDNHEANEIFDHLLVKYVR